MKKYPGDARTISDSRGGATSSARRAPSDLHEIVGVGQSRARERERVRYYAMQCRLRTCANPVEPPRRRYCSQACASEARRLRRLRKVTRRECLWCRKRFLQVRKGNRFCKTACRNAYHRQHRQSTAFMFDYVDGFWPTVPAPVWIEVHCDAGHGKDPTTREVSWWGAVVAWRHVLGGGEPVELACLRGRILPYYGGPTPAEGIAAIEALKWIATMCAEGAICEGEEICLFEDNSAVAAKLRKGDARGGHAAIWRLMVGLVAPLRASGRFWVCGIRSGANRADTFATPHTDARIWQLGPQEMEGYNPQVALLPQ